MAKHLGRNPFEKKKAAPDHSKENNKYSKPAQLLLVNIPAQSYVLALKALLFAKRALGRSS